MTRAPRVPGIAGRRGWKSQLADGIRSNQGFRFASVRSASTEGEGRDSADHQARLHAQGTLPCE